MMFRNNAKAPAPPTLQMAQSALQNGDMADACIMVLKFLCKNRNKSILEKALQLRFDICSAIKSDRTGALMEQLHAELYHIVDPTSCMTAIQIYVEYFSLLCPHLTELAHSMLRIAMRPAFYIGMNDAAIMQSEIQAIVEKIVASKQGKHLAGEYRSFLNWIGNHCAILEVVIKELELCCLFYSAQRDGEKITLTLEREEELAVPGSYYDSITADFSDPMMLQFDSESEYQDYFYSWFHELGIDDLEIKRIYKEEHKLGWNKIG